MADRVRISPSDLESQANRLYALGAQMNDNIIKAGKALQLMEDALSSKFTSNMEKRATRS